MHDLRSDLDTLWRAAGRLTVAKGGRGIMFMSAHDGEGTSSVAASFALMAAEKCRRVTWLVDLDLHENSQFESFRRGAYAGVGKPSRAYDASLGTRPFYDIIEARRGERLGVEDNTKLLAAHQIKGTRLLVTRFRNEQVAHGGKIHLSTRSEWWAALRRGADWFIVDAPPSDRSGAGLAMASQMDGVIIVVEADRTGPLAVTNLIKEIEAYGGHALGVVMNRTRPDTRFIDKFSG